MRGLARVAAFGVALVALGQGALALDPERAISQYARDAWTARDGAPAGTINGITQTPNGYLWLGTQAEGLVRFDGVAFVREGALDALFDRRVDRIISLTCGRDGTLWVGTGFGLARFKDDRWAALDRGESRSVFGLHESPDRVTWYASNWEAVAQVSGDNVTRLPLRGKPNAITSDVRGTLWVGGYEGLWRLSGQERRFYSGADGLSSPYVTGLFGDRAGNVWIGSYHGLSLLRDDKLVVNYTTRDGLSSDQVSTVAVDRDEVLWVGTRDGGLNRQRGARFEALTRAHGLTNNRVTAIFEDREGSLWIGTAGGLNRLRDASVLPIGEPEGLTPGEPSSIAEGPDGSVYVSAGSGGLNQVKDGSVRILRGGTGPASDGPLFVDPDGGVWSGHIGGLACRRQGRRVVYEVAGRSEVRCISRDARSLIFANTAGEIFRLVDGRAEPYRLADGSHLGPATFGITFVRMIHVARDGTLWLATTGGGVIAVRDGVARQAWQRGLLQARSIFEDERGVVWCGTDAGIVRVASDGSVAVVTQRQGLPQDTNFNVLSDGRGGLWMACAGGIFRAKRQDVEDVVEGKVKAFTVEAFGASEGIRSSEAASSYQPAACVAHDGRLWFAIAEGVAVIDPARIRRNPLAPPVVVESVVADHKPLAIAERTRISASTERLAIHYNGLSLLMPQRVRFRYRLTGYDRDWVDAGVRRVAYYTRLPPGRYEFHVIAANNDGVWNDVGASITIRKLPHFYQTAWFMALVVLVVAAAILAAYWLRVRQHIRAERALQARVTAALADIKTLHGLLPICAWCKKVRDDGGYWNQIEEYVSEHTQAEFSHGICPDCREKMRPRADGAPPPA